MIDLDPNEEIFLKVRKHKLVFILEVIFIVPAVLLPPVAYYFLKFLGKIEVSSDTFYLLLFAYSIFLLFLWIIFFKIWTDYYLDILIVTNKRVVDVEQKGFFHRDVSTLRLDRIQDLRVNLKGVLATFLDFGEIYIQTAGEAREFVMRYVPNPNHVKSVIYELHNKSLDAPKPVHIVTKPENIEQSSG